MESMVGQRVVGLVAVGMLGGIIAWVWQHALAGDGFNRWAACVAPALLVFGLALLLFPIDLRVHRQNWDTEKPSRFREFPAAWRVLSFVALVAGVANVLALSRLAP